MLEFAKTSMGRHFFQDTVPELIQELKKLNRNIEDANKLKEQEIILLEDLAKEKEQSDVESDS